MSENRVAPGGTFGWHSHPAPASSSKSGVSTFYSGDDPLHAAGIAGTAYVDPGGSVHIARNEGTEDLVVVVTRIIPRAQRSVSTSEPRQLPLQGGRHSHGGRIRSALRSIRTLWLLDIVIRCLS